MAQQSNIFIPSRESCFLFSLSTGNPFLLHYSDDTFCDFSRVHPAPSLILFKLVKRFIKITSLRMARALSLPPSSSSLQINLQYIQKSTTTIDFFLSKSDKKGERKILYSKSILHDSRNSPFVLYKFMIFYKISRVEYFSRAFFFIINDCL